MPSPFPGMNPFLEQSDTWEDFHGDYIIRLRELLSGMVGANYYVKIEVRLYLHERSAEERRYFGKSDAGVTVSGRPSSAVNASQVLDAPLRLPVAAVEEERHRFLEIHDRRNRRVITVIELLSPTNKKPGPDRDDYLMKRGQILASSVHLVEIDLRRGGQRPGPPELPMCDYYVLVSKAGEREHPGLGVWPIRLEDRLPLVPIPLSDPDPAVDLDLQAVLNQSYDAAKYESYIYQEEPEPPLSLDQLEWARQFIPKRQ